MNNYFQLSDVLALGVTHKAGYTSIKHALTRYRRLTPEQVRQRGLRTRLYLRNPLTRFASAWAYFTPSNNFPGDPVWRNRQYDFLRDHPTVEQFTDAVLDGAEDPHWSPQLAQHMPIDEIRRFEDIEKSFPVALPHHNKGRIEKPVLSYRLSDLEDYYAEDLEAWQTH